VQSLAWLIPRAIPQVEELFPSHYQHLWYTGRKTFAARRLIPFGKGHTIPGFHVCGVNAPVNNFWYAG